MAGTPSFKVYRDGKDYVAALKYAEDAAQIASMHPGAIVKHDGRIVWREGKEVVSGADSVDQAAEIILERCRQHLSQRWAHLRKEA